MFKLSRSKFQKAKQAALAVLASVLPLGAAGAVAAANANTVINSDSSRAAEAVEPTITKETIAPRLHGIGPGVHRFFQRNLTGLEIRAVRIAKRTVATNRMGRSKYAPNGIPARVSKALRNATVPVENLKNSLALAS